MVSQDFASANAYRSTLLQFRQISFSERISKFSRIGFRKGFIFSRFPNTVSYGFGWFLQIEQEVSLYKVLQI